jgi:hypothetical protein
MTDATDLDTRLAELEQRLRKLERLCTLMLVATGSLSPARGLKDLPLPGAVADGGEVSR